MAFFLPPCPKAVTADIAIKHAIQRLRSTVFMVILLHLNDDRLSQNANAGGMVWKIQLTFPYALILS